MFLGLGYRICKAGGVVPTSSEDPEDEMIKGDVWCLVDRPSAGGVHLPLCSPLPALAAETEYCRQSPTSHGIGKIQKQKNPPVMNRTRAGREWPGPLLSVLERKGGKVFMDQKATEAGGWTH